MAIKKHYPDQVSKVASYQVGYIDCHLLNNNTLLKQCTFLQIFHVFVHNYLNPANVSNTWTFCKHIIKCTNLKNKICFIMSDTGKFNDCYRYTLCLMFKLSNASGTVQLPVVTMTIKVSQQH